jgi:LysR family transcriptional regulator, regulator for bpeEF and oprC
MDQLNKMRLFVRLVETGSFSRAGKAEGVVQSTVSKEVSSLERRLGAQLIRRSSRGLSVTEQGQEYYDFAIGMLADLDATELRIRSGEDSPKGRIRVTTPPVFSSKLIVPRLPSLLAQHPELTIDLEVSERYVSLVEDGVDVAIRIGDLADSSLLARQIGCVEAVVVAAPAYLESHGAPNTPIDLERHLCLPFMFQGGSKTWKFRDAKGEIIIAPSAKLRTNDAESVRAAALAGLGLAQGPSWMFAGDIASGTLAPVLIDYTPRLFPIHAVSSESRRMTGAIKAFVDFVAELIKDEPHLRVR